MRHLLFLVVLTTAAVADDITLADGKKRTDATIVRAERDALVVETPAGLERLPMHTLSADLQKRYGWVSPEIRAEQAKAAEKARLLAEAQAEIAREKAGGAKPEKAPAAAPAPRASRPSAGGDYVITQTPGGVQVRQLPKGVTYQRSVGGSYGR